MVKQIIAGTVLIIIGFASLYSFLKNPNPWLIAGAYLVGIAGLMILVELLEWNTYATNKENEWIAKEGQALNEIAALIYYQSPLREQDRWLSNIQSQGIWSPEE